MITKSRIVSEKRTFKTYDVVVEEEEWEEYVENTGDSGKNGVWKLGGGEVMER